MSVSFYITDMGIEEELNLSNANASDIMRLMGMTATPEGELPVKDMHIVRNRIDELLDGDSYKQGVRPTTMHGKISYCGIDAAYVVRRLADFRQLIIRAQTANSPIYWG